MNTEFIVGNIAALAMYCLKYCYNVKRKSILLFLKRVSCLCLVYMCVQWLAQRVTGQLNLNSDNEPVTKSSSSALSHSILLTVHVNTPACFLSQHCPYSLLSNHLGNTQQIPGPLYSLIWSGIWGLPVTGSDLAAAAHINICCFHSANVIRSIWTWYLGSTMSLLYDCRRVLLSFWSVSSFVKWG